MTEFCVRQEADTVACRAVVGTALVAAVVGALGVFFAGLLLALSAGSLRPDVTGPAGRRGRQRIISQVEQTPVETARTGIELRERQRQELDSWGWVDREAGIAHIPIERAIDVIVAGGTQ